VEETSSAPVDFRTSLARLISSTRVAMHGEENSALLQAAFISLCFEFRDTRADQGAGSSAHCSPTPSPASPAHDRTRGDEWAEARNRQKSNTCQQAERATNYATGGHACCRTLGRFRSLFRAHVFGAAETLRQQYGNIGSRGNPLS